MGFFRPTYAEINLSSLVDNLNVVRGAIPKGAKIMAMVKADAYGHGAIEISRRLEDSGVESLGVATVEEGLELRQSGVKAPIVVMGGLMGMGSPASGMMVGANLTPVVHSVDVLEFLEAVSKAAQKVIGIQLKVDSGMGRLGALPSHLDKILDLLKKCTHLRLDGVMTHFAEAEDEDYTAYQAGVFEGVREKIEHDFGKVGVWHMANSAALIDGRHAAMKDGGETWVRPGIMLYGAYPAPKYREKVSLKSVMSLKSAVVLIKTVPPGTKVSYGCTYTTDKKTRLGVVPIGYADGYPWALSNKASVLIREKRFNVVGRVTMDMIMVDVTDREIHVGDEVVLLGRQGDLEVTVEELSEMAGTIPYEFFCGISKRMPRVYIG